MTVTVADNHRDRIGKIYCDRDIKSDCSKKESDRDSIVIEIMTETVTTALIETATQGLT